MFCRATAHFSPRREYQVVAHFFNRPYWQQPANLAEPFDGTAQPVRETWSDCTLEKVAMKVRAPAPCSPLAHSYLAAFCTRKSGAPCPGYHVLPIIVAIVHDHDAQVDLLDRRSFSTATTIHLLQHDVDEVLAHEERGVKRGK